jgi:hypothetical protein
VKYKFIVCVHVCMGTYLNKHSPYLELQLGQLGVDVVVFLFVDLVCV